MLSRTPTNMCEVRLPTTINLANTMSPKVNAADGVTPANPRPIRNVTPTDGESIDRYLDLSGVEIMSAPITAITTVMMRPM
jgi:hypothetical protein